MVLSLVKLDADHRDGGGLGCHERLSGAWADVAGASSAGSGAEVGTSTEGLREPGGLCVGGVGLGGWVWLQKETYQKVSTFVMNTFFFKKKNMEKYTLWPLISMFFWCVSCLSHIPRISQVDEVVGGLALDCRRINWTWMAKVLLVVGCGGYDGMEHVVT